MPLQNSDLWEPRGELTGFQTSAQGTQADGLALTQFCCLFGGRREIRQARICLSEAPQKNGPAVGCHTWVSSYVEGRKEGSWTEQGLAVVTVPGDSTFGSGLVPALGTFLCPSLQPPPAVNLAITSAPQRVPHGQPLVGLSVTCGLQPASFCL